MKILIVDDSSVMRKIVRKSLRQAGLGSHEVEEAANGQEGLAQIDASCPDLVLCDWNMPEMSGMELLQALRGRECPVPFCFVTSEATNAMRSEAHEAGANGFVTKPFTPDSLRDALEPLLG